VLIYLNTKADLTSEKSHFFKKKTRRMWIESKKKEVVSVSLLTFLAPELFFKFWHTLYITSE